MNVVRSSRSATLPKGGRLSASSASKKVTLNLYQDFPKMEVSLDDFEEFALDRLKVRTLAHYTKGTNKQTNKKHSLNGFQRLRF